MSIGWQTVLSGRYVITGGLGGLGLRAASLLVTRGVIEAKLASRSGRVTRDGQAELRSLGSSAKVVACDGADSSDARFLFGHAVSGVLHAAGMLNDRMVRLIAVGDVQQAAEPKAVGASLVHSLLVRSPVDAIGLFSSVASTFGNICLLYTSPSPRDS